MSTPPVIPAAALYWRDNNGLTLTECVADWLQGLPTDYLPPLVEPHARRAIERGEFCGARVASEHDEGADYLMMPAALAACVASLGLASETTAALHHALGDMVDAGHLSATLEAHRLPVLGKTWLYRVHASLLEEFQS